MKSLFLITLLLISFTAILSKETKNIYKCASDLKVDTCYFKDYQSTESLDTYTYYVNACPKGKYCIELSDKGNEDGILVNQCMKKKHYLDEGDKCAIGSECKSGVCTDNKCVTYEEGHTCSSSKECKTGLYCKTNDKANACTKYLKKGDSCKEGTCRPGLECSHGQCINMHSMNNGEKSDNWWACKSGEHFLNKGERQCGEVTSVGECDKNNQAVVKIQFSSEETYTVGCSGHISELDSTYTALKTANYDRVEWKNFVTELEKHIDDILEDDDYLEYQALDGYDTYLSFGIKELQKLWIEYHQKAEIEAAADDDAKECVREYYLRQLNSNKLYISLFGLLLSVVALL